MPKQFQPVLSLDDQAALAAEGRLLEVGRKSDEKLRERVTRLLLGSAEVILKLGDLDLVRHEADEERGGHTLALWEELAPVMGETVQHVNELIANASAQFLPPPEKANLDNLDAAFGPGSHERADVVEAPVGMDVEIAGLVAAVCSGLRRDVAHLGERLRNPNR